MTKPSDGPWYYQQIDLGFNYRMTELQAALGLSQIARLQRFVDHRHDLANRYDKNLRNLPLVLPTRSSESHSSLHLYIIQLQIDAIKLSHREVFEALRAAGIGVNLHYIPIYLQPYYASLGFKQGYCPEAERYYSRSISIPLFHMMTEAQQDQVISTLRDVIR